MTKDINTMETTLKQILLSHAPALKVTKDTDAAFEVSGTKPAMQGKKKVDGHYFASVMRKPKDVRLYFFPIYTHVDHFKDVPADLLKFLKGKSCFHIKMIDEEIEAAITDMVAKGVSLYQQDELI